MTTGRFRNLSKPLKPFLEIALPQRVSRPALSTKDKSDLWNALHHDGDTAVRSIKATDTYTLYEGRILGEHMYLGEANSTAPSYRDLFFAAFYEETFLPSISGTALSFFHTEKLSEFSFSVSNFLVELVEQKYATIVSDKKHSEDGTRLWLSFIRKAYHNRWTVALFNTKSATYVDVSDQPNYVERNAHKIWGNTEAFKHIRLLVTTKKLPTKG